MNHQVTHFVESSLEIESHFFSWCVIMSSLKHEGILASCPLLSATIGSSKYTFMLLLIELHYFAPLKFGALYVFVLHRVFVA